MRAEPTAVFTPEWVGIDPTTDPVLATYFLFHDTDLATLRQALPTVSRCDLSAIYAETPTVAPAARSSTYLLPASDRTLTRERMYRMARERLHVDPVEVPGGHNNYVAHAQPIAEAIDQATELPASTPHPGWAPSTCRASDPLSGWWVAPRPRYRPTNEDDRICLSGCVETWMQCTLTHGTRLRSGQPARIVAHPVEGGPARSGGRFESIWPAAQAPSVRKRCCVES